MDLIRKYKPEIVLFGATTQGRDFAGTVATTLEAGLTADCTGLDIDPETKYLKQTRPAFGGNIMATILDYPNYRPQMSTVRPKVFPMPPRDDSRKGEVIRETSPDDGRSDQDKGSGIHQRERRRSIWSMRRSLSREEEALEVLKILR